MNTQGQYNGEYIEEFNFGQDPVDLKFNGDLGEWWGLSARGNRTNEQGYNLADIKVWWYDNCPVWIDYVKVENDVAEQLFNGDWDDQIEDEALIAEESPEVYKFYIEYIEFNNLPCIKYVNEKLRQYTTNDIDLVVDFHDYGFFYHVPYEELETISSAQWLYDNFIVRGGFSMIFSQCYPMKSRYYDPPDPTWTTSRIPPTLPITGCPPNTPCGVLAYPSATTTAYDAWLQENYDHSPFYLENGTAPDKPGSLNPCNPYEHPELKGNFRYTLQVCDEISRLGNIPFVFMPQAHHWYTPHEINREPTNEELEVMANLSVSYGARGLVWWWYPSFEDNSNPTCPQKSYGMTSPPNNTLRQQNVYGQTKYKWHVFRDIGIRMKKWETALMSFSNTDRHSYIYRLEREDLLEETYFFDIVSYIRGSGVPPCQTDAPDTTDAPGPSGLIYECYEERYLQVATFKNPNEPNTPYFMIVNRRCSPLQTTTHNDGERYVRVFFDYNSPELDNFNNWSIVDIETGNTIAVVNNTYYHPYADLGWFNPAQGKLYKMVPTIKHGGTLVADEDVSGQTFTCEDTVLNGGYNITIDSGTTVSFTDSATIIMSGGTFTSGIHGEDNLTTYKGLGSANWNGMRFEGTTVKIYNSKFQDIASPIVNYAVSMLNCPLADIRTNEFVLDTDTAGAVQSVYIEPASPGPVSADLYINYNTITMNQSRGNGISVQGFSALTLPVYIMNNTMSSDGYATGIMLSTITGGAVKKNTITGFSSGVNALLSSVDFYGNIISNTSSVSKGIMASGLSSLGLVPSGGLWLGGFNEITNTSGASTNIEVNNSIFILDGGNNSFDITSTYNHLYGSFWDDAYPVNHRYNCFSESGTDITSPTLPNDDITDGTDPVTLTYLAYTCGGTPPSGTYIADIGNGLYDTIQSSSEGPGGGGHSINNGQLTINNKKLKANQKRVEQTFLSVYTLTPSQLYDSARVNMRKKNYSGVKTFCLELINNYPSAHEALSSLQALYISWMAVDTTQSGVTALKTFYETLILNNGSNTALVKISNYLIQKCKVSLGSYSSALSGFGQIINNNPYSYEGLLARWDYMATSLLVPAGGSHSSIINEQLSMFNSESDKSYESDESWWGDDDKSPFTKEQKQDIVKSITTAFEITKNNDEVKIKTLETASENGNESAASELHHMKALKEIVKTERPKTMTEHIRTVSSDVQKIFGSSAPVSTIKGSNVPIVFSLAQNFPNPFNPVTTIKYALPKDVKVVIKIYDILGREVRTLVNEIRKAGYYDVKFDMSSYASGVYFYRIEAGEYVQSKKMVLVK